uniref:Uncharacterized protein n=1 Tax=Octopus bimaculoides TaxID=37653 RepID=A0A0L8G599_OCTBM
MLFFFCISNIREELLLSLLKVYIICFCHNNNNNNDNNTNNNNNNNNNINDNITCCLFSDRNLVSPCCFQFYLYYKHMLKTHLESQFCILVCMYVCVCVCVYVRERGRICIYVCLHFTEIFMFECGFLCMCPNMCVSCVHSFPCVCTAYTHVYIFAIKKKKNF